MSGDDHNNTTEPRDLDALHKSALALVAKMEALGYEFSNYTSGDYLHDVEAPLIERASRHGRPAEDE